MDFCQSLLLKLPGIIIVVHRQRMYKKMRLSAVLSPEPQYRSAFPCTSAWNHRTESKSRNAGPNQYSNPFFRPRSAPAIRSVFFPYQLIKRKRPEDQSKPSGLLWPFDLSVFFRITIYRYNRLYFHTGRRISLHLQTHHHHDRTRHPRRDNRPNRWKTLP